MNLDSKDSTVWIGNIPFKTWKQRQNNNNSKFFSFTMCSWNSFHQAFNNFVFNSHKKLIFNVDKVLWILDQLLICIMDGRLMGSLFNSYTPLGSASAHLQCFWANRFSRSCFNEQLRKFLLPPINQITQLFCERYSFFSFFYFLHIVFHLFLFIFGVSRVKSLIISFFHKIKDSCRICQQLWFHKIPILNKMP